MCHYLFGHMGDEYPEVWELLSRFIFNLFVASNEFIIHHIFVRSTYFKFVKTRLRHCVCLTF